MTHLARIRTLPDDQLIHETQSAWRSYIHWDDPEGRNWVCYDQLAKECSIRGLTVELDD